MKIGFTFTTKLVEPALDMCLLPGVLVQISGITKWVTNVFT